MTEGNATADGISIHAPAGGATAVAAESTEARPKFQFTPLREGRRSTRNGRDQLRLISIHAPAGGATLKPPSPVTPLAYFNSRPCGRGDFL